MANEMNLWKRLQADTPAFFKRVIAFSVTLAAVGTALIGTELAITGFVLPTNIHLMAQWFIVGGLVGAAISKTTVSNSYSGGGDTPYYSCASFSTFPSPGETGSLYLDRSTGSIYEFNGTGYVPFTGSRPSTPPTFLN